MVDFSRNVWYSDDMMGVLFVYSDKIKKLRQKAKMTQWELGERLGVSASAIGMYEQGRRQPDPKTLIKLSRIFSVSVDEILGDSQSDILALCDEFLKGLSKRELYFDGKILTKAEFSLIDSAVRVSLQITSNKIAEDRKSGR